MWLGIAAAAAAELSIAFYCDPSAWVHYRSMISADGIQQEFVPTIAVALRFLIDRNAMWIEFLPAVIGCAWAAWYYSSHRENWEWREQGAVLLIIGVLVTPYAWDTDSVLLLPAIMLGIARRSQRSLCALLAIMTVASVQCMIMPGSHSPSYLWLAPALAIWCLCAPVLTQAQPR